MLVILSLLSEPANSAIAAGSCDRGAFHRLKEKHSLFFWKSAAAASP
jgi:hypothetical protein